MKIAWKTGGVEGGRKGEKKLTFSFVYPIET